MQGHADPSAIDYRVESSPYYLSAAAAAVAAAAAAAAECFPEMTKIHFEHTSSCAYKLRGMTVSKRWQAQEQHRGGKHQQFNAPRLPVNPTAAFITKPCRV